MAKPVVQLKDDRKAIDEKASPEVRRLLNQAREWAQTVEGREVVLFFKDENGLAASHAWAEPSTLQWLIKRLVESLAQALAIRATRN